MALITKATGGSSGTPLQFDLNTDSAQRREAAWHRGYSWGGAEPGRKLVFLWSISLGKRPWWSEVKDDLYHRLYRRGWLNTFDVGEHTTLQYLRRINRSRPDAIVAYTHSLFAFARSLKERGLKPYSPRSIVVGAEKLYPFQRALIEEVFDAPVFETYGSREFMLIGAECDRHEGLHLTQENLLVEVLDDDGNPTPPGQEGNVTITDLYNYGMPFIRYTNGDRAIAGWAKCSCGRGLPLLKEVTGRRSEMIHTADGRHLSGVFFPHLMKEFAAVRRFLVVQDTPNHLGVHLVLGPQWTEDDGVLLRREIQKAVGPAMNVDLVPVQEIPLTSAGKHRVVLNLCSTSGQEPDRHGPAEEHATYSSKAKASVISN